MKKKLIVLCAFLLIQALICSAVSFADEINETNEDYTPTETTKIEEMTDEEMTDEEILSDVEKEVEEEILSESEETTDDEILIDDEEKVEEKVVEPQAEEEVDEEILESFEEEPEEDIVEETLTETEETLTETKETLAETEETLTGTEENLAKTEEDIVDNETQEVVISTESECSDEEKLDDVYTESEKENIEDKVATSSTVSIKFNWLSNVCLDDIGMGGSYDANWKTIHIESGDEFEIPEEIALVLNYENCDQVYNLIGFTTNNQEETYWLYADYAGGEKMYDNASFVVDEDIELWAVYEAKYKYVSSINVDNENITYKYTTIPNLAIKDIKKIDSNDENFVIDDEVFENYKFIEFGDEFIAYTKCAQYGQFLNEMDIKKYFIKGV